MTTFDYMYRDAGNFKAFGSVTLAGSLTHADRELIRSQLHEGEFFIAEQVGIPPLYGELFKWSCGPTESDHCWHEFLEFREVAAPEFGFPITDAGEFVSRFAAVDLWDESLSPNFSTPETEASTGGS